MKRMDEYGAQAEAGTLELAKQLTPEEQREHETITVAIARLAARRANDVVYQLIEETERQLREGKIKDPSRAALNLATAGKQLTEHGNLIEGKATSIVVHHDLDDLLKGLNQVAPGAIGYDAEASAEEIPEASQPDPHRSGGTESKADRAGE